MSATEIERKFLIECVPATVDAASATRVRQGYLAVCPEAEARIRESGDVHTLTVKSTGGLERTETEVLLRRTQFEALWPVTESRRIEKRRLRVVLAGGLVAEVDIYDGALAGLIVAEVEFVSREAATQFEPPNWFGCEVTDDPRYRNAALASLGIPGRESSRPVVD